MTIELKIEGMHCGGCVSAVRRVLESVPLVTSVSVDLDGSRARVEVAPGADPARLVSAVEDAGYDARVEKLSW